MTILDVVVGDGNHNKNKQTNNDDNKKKKQKKREKNLRFNICMYVHTSEIEERG